MERALGHLSPFGTLHSVFDFQRLGNVGCGMVVRVLRQLMRACPNRGLDIQGFVWVGFRSRRRDGVVPARE